jgi:hypothetical protein
MKARGLWHVVTLTSLEGTAKRGRLPNGENTDVAAHANDIIQHREYTSILS